MSELGTLLRELGGWGVAVLLLGGIKVLWDDLKASQAARIALAEDQLTLAKTVFPLVEELKEIIRRFKK